MHKNTNIVWNVWVDGTVNKDWCNTLTKKHFLKNITDMTFNVAFNTKKKVRHLAK